MSIVGLVLLARERGMRLRLPAELVDFAPTPESTHEGTLPIWDVLDRDAFLAVAGDILTDTEPATERVTQLESFSHGGKQLGLRNPEAVSIMRALIPAGRLRRMARKVSLWHRFFDHPIGLQLRIERDFRAYIQRKFRGVPPPTLPLDAKGIFRKIRATPELSDVRSIWCCCDEADLEETRGAIKAIGREFDLNVRFKSDLPAIVRPQKLQSRLLLSAVEFEIAASLPAYIGTERSTFTKMLRHFAPSQKAWRYDTDLSRVVLAR